MALYVVKVREIHHSYYSVEADNENDAMRRYDELDDEAGPIDTEFIDSDVIDATPV